MNALRRAASLIAIVTLLGLGCQSSDRAEEKRIRVALPQWFSPSEKDPWLQQAWQTIREQNPGWTIDLETVPGKTEQVLQKLLVVRASGEGPDLACVRLESMPVLVEQGILQPMQGTVPAEVWQSMIPALAPGVEWKGERYVLPYDIGVRVILYRRDLFDGAGIPPPSPSWTWDDLVAGATRLTQDLDGNGTIDQWGFGVPAARSRKATLQWLPWFWALGGRLQQEDGRIKLCTPAAIEAMQWYRDLAHRYRVTPPTFYAMDQDTIFQGLAGGLFAMSEGGSWERAMLRKYSQYSEMIGIARLPAPRPDASSATLVDGWGFGVLTQDPKKLPVLRRVLEHLCSTGHQLAKYRASGMLSPFRPVVEDPEFARDPDSGVLTAALLEARPTPPLASFPSVSEALEIVLQQVLMDGTKPAEALAAQDERLRRRPEPD